MNKKVINVPMGIRYISEWCDFKLPDYPHIMDKKIPGCGFTEWCITNNEDVVLCSPRKILLQNKKDQHPQGVFLVVNEYEKIVDSGKDLTKVSKNLPQVVEIPEDKKKEYFNKLSHDLLIYIKNRRYLGLAVKILVTYDSFKLVYEILHYNRMDREFRIIVDEFQSIFTDSRFKSDTEMTFMTYLKKLQKVCFVSATPMIDTYLDRLDDFKFLHYFELDWEKLQPGRVKKPKLRIYRSQSIINSARRILEPYMNNKYEVVYYKDFNGMPQKKESRECVIYVNSVNNIISIIKKFDLKPEEVNILVANTEENKKKIKNRLSKVNEGKVYDIGSVPLKGQPRKKYTFCTRTVYLGADFYSDNARTFILSDANIETLAVDISLDLPQILGRQRLEENPWKNEASFYYIPLAYGNKEPRDVFDERIKQKLKVTNDLLLSHQVTPEDSKESLVGQYELLAKTFNYRDQFVAVNREYDPTTMTYTLKPVQNDLVLIAEQRAFDIQQVDYADRFTVFNTLNTVVNNNDRLNEEIESFMSVFEGLPKLYNKLKYFCDYVPKDSNFRTEILGHITEKHFKDYVTVLGIDRCRALGYNITKLNKELNMLTFNMSKLDSEIYKQFNIGDKLTREDVKNRLSNIYTALGYNKTPKAIDLEKWFDIKKVQINIRQSDGTYKRIPSFEIIKKKS